MKTYLTSTGYVGTQAEAKSIDPGKPLEIVEIPTDKDGLLAFVNQSRPDTTDIPQATDREQDLRARIAELEALHNYTTNSVKIDEDFENLSLSVQLHLAALALENARKRLKP